MITKRDFSIKQFTLYLLLLLFLSSVQLIAQSNQTLEQRPGDASYKSAVGFHRQGLYKEALELYHKSLNDPTNQREGLSIVIEKNIAECEYGIRRKSTPEPVTVTKLASDVNRPNASNVNAFSGNKEHLI
ncbi:MAG: hypothetical protein LBF67_04210, partial [Prevotellaceae bacterium]|nr:hypothetical protein [Prevotellaceae bacterium]